MLIDDVLGPGLKVVFCGTALGTRSAEAGAYYAGPGNKFWPALHAVGLTPRKLDPAAYREVLAHGIGLTDVCKTRSGSDREVGSGGFDRERLESAIAACSPRWLAFNGKRAAREALGDSRPYGVQPDRLGGARLFVLPSTSGAASGYWDPGRWRELAELIA